MSIVGLRNSTALPCASAASETADSVLRWAFHGRFLQEVLFARRAKISSASHFGELLHDVVRRQSPDSAARGAMRVMRPRSSGNAIGLAMASARQNRLQDWWSSRCALPSLVRASASVCLLSVLFVTFPAQAIAWLQQRVYTTIALDGMLLRTHQQPSKQRKAGSTAFPNIVARGAGRRTWSVGEVFEKACTCCEKDWCGCIGCYDCHSYLKARGHKVPKTAEEAHAAAGADWPSQLRWRSARMPKWRPMSARAFNVTQSTIPNAGMGLLASSDLPAGSVLPPYQGKLLSFTEAKAGGRYVWCPRVIGERILAMSSKQADAIEGLSFCVDATHASAGNPARFVNAAYTKEQRKAMNVEICEIGQVMYFRTTTAVARGVELLTDYGTAYSID